MVRLFASMMFIAIAAGNAFAADPLWEKATKVAQSSNWKPNGIDVQAVASDGKTQTGRESIVYEVRSNAPAYAVVVRHIVNDEETGANVGDRVPLKDLYSAVQRLFDPDQQRSVDVVRKDDVVIDGKKAVNFEFKMPGARGRATLLEANGYPIAASWELTPASAGMRTSSTRVAYVTDADGTWHPRTLITTAVLDVPEAPGVPSHFTMTFGFHVR